MTSKRLWLLALVAIVAVAIALWAERNRRPQTVSGAEAELLFARLDEQLNDVKQVTIKVAGDASAVTLVKGEDRWTVAEKASYLADIGKLRELLVDLGAAKLVEPKTSIAENYARLGVEDVSATDATGVLLEIEGAGEPRAVIVGKIGTRAESTYVRRPGDAQSWLADRDLRVDNEPIDWLDDSIVDIKSSRVQQVDIVRTGGEKLTAAKESRADINYALADLPKGKVLTSPGAANAIANVLTALTFDDVVPAAGFDTQGREPTHATYKGFDGLIIDAQAFELGEGEHFAAFSARFDREQAMRFYAPPAPPEPVGEVTDPAASAAQDDAEVGPPTASVETETAAANEADVSAAAEPVIVDAETESVAVAEAAETVEAPNFSAIEQEAADISARLSGWVFRIPAYKHAQMIRTVDDLVKDEE